MAINTYNILEKLLEWPQRIRTIWLVKRGLRLGPNCKISNSVYIDATFPWLVSIGSDCTFGLRAIVLAHDGSTRSHLGYVKVGAVNIGNKCFIGANAIILPNVHIGHNVIVGAGSVVTHDIPDNSVVAGNPAKVISNMDNFINLHSTSIKKFLSENKDLQDEISIKKLKTLHKRYKKKILYVP